VGDAEQSAPPQPEVQHSAPEAWHHYWAAAQQQQQQQQQQAHGQGRPHYNIPAPSWQHWEPQPIQQGQEPQPPQEQVSSDAPQLEQQFVLPQAWPTQHMEPQPVGASQLSPEAAQLWNQPPEPHPPQPVQWPEKAQLEQPPPEAWPTQHWAPAEQLTGANQRSEEAQTPGAVQLGEGVQPTQPPTEAASHPWRQTQAPPQKRSRVAVDKGVITTWRQQRYGFARFLGYDERVLIHQSDCVDQVLQVGDCVTGHLHRRRCDGKLQLFKVTKIAAESPLDERVRVALLGLA